MAAPLAHFASASLYVGDLHKDVTEGMLYEVFNSVGPVASIRVCRDSSTGRSLGYAYVNYHSVGDAERALDTLNYTHIKNMPCRIMWSHRDPSLRKSGAGNIFVKNLDKNIDNKALYDTFSLFGNILSCKVVQDEFGKSRGFGFVHYETEEAAESAIERVNTMKIGSKTVYVGHFKKRSERTSQMEDKYTNVYVKNIPADWDEERISNTFGEYGEVTSVAIQTDTRGRRFGFVNFANAEAAKDSVTHLHHKTVAEPTEDGEKGETSGEKKEGAEEAKDGETTPSVGRDKPRSTADGDASDGEGDDGSKGKGSGDEDGSRAEDDPTRLYVTRFQPRAERMALLKCKFDQSAEQRQKKLGVNLYIKNIHDSVNDDALRELFEPFGTITSAKVMLDDNGVSRGFGFVSYLSPDEATKAVTEMHLKLVEGKPLYAGLHEKREERMQRLQQKLRAPHIRPRMPAGLPAIQFGAPPPQMYFGGTSGAMQQSGGHMVYPPVPNRSAPGNYPQASSGMIPWSRGQPPMRGYGPGQQPGMGGHSMNMGGYPSPVSPTSGHAMNTQAGGDSPMAMAQMGAGPGGVMVQARGGGTRIVNSQMQTQVGQKQLAAGAVSPGMAMQQQKPPVGFKYPPHGVRPRDLVDPSLWTAAAGQMGVMSGMPPIPAAVGGSVLPQSGIHGMQDLSMSADILANAPASLQKHMLGEKLFPLIERLQPQLAGKITGMMLDMDNSELLNLLDSEAQLKAKVDEALRVLHQAASSAPARQQPPVSQQMPPEAEV